MGAYRGKADTFKAADDKTDSFKKGGMAKKTMSSAKDEVSDRKQRKSGGAVFSSASSGTKRGSGSHY